MRAIVNPVVKQFPILLAKVCAYVCFTKLCTYITGFHTGFFVLGGDEHL